MINKTLVFVVFCFLYNIYFTHAQNNDLTINSKVINSSTNEPVVFATVRIKNKNLATIADENGYFRIPKKYQIANDTIQVSSIGYETLFVPLQRLDEKIINIIKLNTAVEKLTEVEVFAKKRIVSLKAEQIITNAIKKIPENYPQLNYSYIGYYRDYQLGDNEYINLNEALVEVFDGGFQTNQYKSKFNQTLLYNYQANTNFKIDSSTAIAYDNKRNKYVPNAYLSSFGGNELSILNIHDPIRNYKYNTFSYINILETNFIENHNFILVGDVQFNGNTLYHIKFSSKKDFDKDLVHTKGDLYIEHLNFAIHKLEYAGYKISEPNSSFGNRLDRIFEKDPFYTIKLEYAKQENFMYLNYISFNNVFRTVNGDDLRVKNLIYDRSDNTITFEFNNALNPANILNPKNYKLSYKKDPIAFDSISLIQENKVQIYLNSDKGADLRSLNKEEITELKYKLRNIRDTEDRKIGKVSYKTVSQFRELFVQKVFPYKLLPKDALFVDKTSPLSLAEFSIFDEDINTYWINTPLKRTKKNDEDLP